MTASPRIAVVGSGCSGIGALWALRESPCETHLYESDSRLGGHTNTVAFTRGKSTAHVDAGFITFNHEAYPNFVKFINYLGISRVPSEMSLAYSQDGGTLEWSGTSLYGLFAQPSNLLSAKFWRMIFDIIRFNILALGLIISSPEAPFSEKLEKPSTSMDPERFQSIGSYLHEQGYSKMFIDVYLIPILAATWCTRPDIFQLQCPARDVIRFMWNQHLLESLINPLTWYTIPGGSRTYIDRFMARHPPSATFLNTAATKLERQSNGTILLHTSTGETRTYDHVILTSSAALSLQILGGTATADERHILSHFTTCTNTVWLHSDLALMPKRRSAWSGWNYLESSSKCATTTANKLAAPTPAVTFDMNTLNHVSREEFGPVLITMNPAQLPERSSIQGSWTYEHPVFSCDAVRAQDRLPEIQERHGVSFAGAWTGYGFHEDGFTSGIRAAVAFLEQQGLNTGPESCFARGYDRPLPERFTPWIWLLQTFRSWAGALLHL